MILVLLWLAVCLMPVPLAVRSLELATGQVGTPGTLRVVWCEALGEGRYDCRGWFTPDRGGPAVEVAASPDSEPGDVRRAQLTPEGDRAVQAGPKGVLAALSLPGMGLAGLGFLPYVVMYWLEARRGRRAAVTGGVLVTAAGTVLMVAGLVAAYS
ncbi:hypothetical protein [Nonomuraea gerenzanensis]|uniref:Uncharacterized protein n=1 Tax=Nonomuraea gerenzanensis TaxID=93944 RepID=A0A1M4EHA8_9ACTN|nr:hypothetical protein [Nonomuraea gerenzanensis]UBU09831.1 hypothetical protein LCN96_36495 [Nonomuraea gerenzanensis]SBO98279.1 hypothetical protein BN4615_P7795 [Nonomuraea gerenzanensis]